MMTVINCARNLNLSIRTSGIYAQPTLHPGEWEALSSLGFFDTNRSSHLGQITRLSDSQQKKRTCRIVKLVDPAGHRVKVKENEKRDKYLDFARELKSIEHEDDGDTICSWCAWNYPKRIGKGTGRLGN